MSLEHEQHKTLYSRLNQIRLDWCTSKPDLPNLDVAQEYLLDASELQNIPDFYIRLGEAINGKNGYYGGCLDALEDCLCGGFGVVPPFTLRIRNSDQLEYGFRQDAVNYWTDNSETENEESATKPNAFDNRVQDWNYLDELLQILKTNSVTVILD